MQAGGLGLVVVLLVLVLVLVGLELRGFGGDDAVVVVSRRARFMFASVGE